MRPRVLKREVLPRPSLADRIATVALVLAPVAMVMASAPGHRHCWSESTFDRAKLTVQKFANEAYPQWSRRHKGCPRSLDELTEYMDTTRTLDPWGQPYRLSCSKEPSWRTPIGVWSIGEDGIANTGDDIKSWD